MLMKISVQNGGIIEHVGAEKCYAAIKEAGFTAIDWNLDHGLTPTQIKGLAYAGVSIFERPIQEVLDHYAPELALIRKNGVFVAHCPASNMNLTSGIAPIRKYLELGLHIGLGSDVAGGHSDSIFRAITDAIQVSKMYFRMVDEAYPPLLFSEAFYLATKGGGAFFGKVGSFERGYEFDAIVMDDVSLPHPQRLTLSERMERAVYLGLDEKNIIAKFVAGRKI
jgi:guanine deaminase